MNLAALKTVGVFTLIGGVIGNAFATLISPVFLTWYNTGGVGATQAICDMPKMSKAIFNQLIFAQLVGTGIGALAFMVLGALVARQRLKRERDTAVAVT